MAFDISEICDPVVVAGAGRKPSVFRLRVEALPIGKAILISGMTRNNAISRAAVIGNQQNPKRKFSSTVLEDGRVQITRVT